MEGKLDFITSERDPQRSAPRPSTLGILLCLNWGHDVVGCPASVTIQAPGAGAGHGKVFLSLAAAMLVASEPSPTSATLKEEFFLLRALLHFVTKHKDQPFFCFFTLGKKSRMQTHNHRATFYQGTLLQVGQL